MGMTTFTLFTITLVIIVGLPTCWQSYVCLAIFWLIRALWTGRKEVMRWLKEPLK